MKFDWKQKLRVKYFQPNSNCTYLARKMWYLYSKGKLCKIIAKFLYLRIWHKYGCCIYPSAKVERGFLIVHPVGIVIGNCKIGEDFRIFQNCTIGRRYSNEQVLDPIIGNRVTLCCGSNILGGVSISDDVLIGAQSLVNRSIFSKGTYVGIPVHKLK